MAVVFAFLLMGNPYATSRLTTKHSNVPDATSLNTILITSAANYSTFVIPAKAGIQEETGCRIKSGMTALAI
jgi:hypothetical protein